MIKYIIDSSYCFSEEIANKYDVSLLETCVTFDDVLHYSNPYWKNIDPDYYLDYMKNGGLPRISQAPLQKWIDSLLDFVKEENTYVYVSPHKQFGGGLRCFNIIKTMAPELKDKVYVFEGTGAGTSIEIEVLELLNRTTKDTTISDVEKWVTELNSKIDCYDISESLYNWLNSGRSEVTTDFKQGWPIMKLTDDGSTFGNIYIGETFEDSLSRLKDMIKDKGYKKMVVSYTHGISDSYMDKFKQTIYSKDCELLTEHRFSPNVMSIVGVNSIGVAFV